MCRLFAVLLLLTVPKPVAAQTEWSARQIENPAYPPEIVAETRTAAPDGLPDGLVAVHEGAGDIRAAWYTGPTTRYRHGILGDAVEAAELRIMTAAGETHTVALANTEVFEDRYPRLADLDGDGTAEVITIRSSTTAGAAVTVYGLVDNSLVERASTGFIGRANRWLNIAGIADFQGRTGKQIAYVQTPHIGGTLFVYRYDNGELVRVGEMYGFSNHVIGSTEMRLSAIADVNGDGRPDLAVPSADRRTLRLVGFVDDELTEFGSVRLPARVDKTIAVKGAGAMLRFVVGLDNAEVYEIRR